MVESSAGETRNIHVTGTDRFRCVAIFGTLIAGAISLVLELLDPRPCDIINLSPAIYICTAVHVCTFLLLLASYICPGCIRWFGKGVGLVYFLIVGGMIGV